ncbi:MAG TPA: hypothetical protein VND21_09555, partial [Planctomycetota bacterium]|nr:hypothetical protein [Planctomycetota bacterium]
ALARRASAASRPQIPRSSQAVATASNSLNSTRAARCSKTGTQGQPIWRRALTLDHPWLPEPSFVPGGAPPCRVIDAAQYWMNR